MLTLIKKPNHEFFGRPNDEDRAWVIDEYEYGQKHIYPKWVSTYYCNDRGFKMDRAEVKRVLRKLAKTR